VLLATINVILVSMGAIRAILLLGRSTEPQFMGRQSTMRALSDLLYALSRIPGLSFLRGIARSIYDVDNVGRSAKRLQDKVSKD
jgi:hypothetical protein